MADALRKLAYTIEEAVEASGHSRAVLYRKHQAGEITMRKAGRRTLILVEDLERLLGNLPALARSADAAA